jgi:SAM-dependent methyltransferase
MSPFLRWVLSSLGDRPLGQTWVELGSGYGRDLRALRARGYSAVGVDVSRVGTAIARRSGVTVVRGEALRFLSEWPEGSVDVVFSNLFYSLEFSEDDHRRLFDRVHRALVPRGFHAYSVRTVADPWYGKGVAVGPDTFDLAPDGAVMHFFSREYARRLRAGRFRCVRTWEGVEDPGGFPIRVLYVLEQKLRSSRN